MSELTIVAFVDRVIADGRARQIIFPLKWEHDFLTITDARGQKIMSFPDSESALRFAEELKEEIRRRRDILALFSPIKKP